jgi:signal transducing adaptor molecule
LPSASGMHQQSPHQFPPQQQQAQQAPYPTSPPSHQPPPIPGAAPASQPTQYTAFNPAPSAPPTGEYQAYQPSQAGGPASNPASFYR